MKSRLRASAVGIKGECSHSGSVSAILKLRKRPERELWASSRWRSRQRDPAEPVDGDVDGNGDVDEVEGRDRITYLGSQAPPSCERSRRRNSVGPLSL